MEGRILPPLPGLAVPGNLLWLINRSGKDTRTLITNDEISPIMTATSDPLWLLRASSALSAKRLVDALNLVHARELEKQQMLRRILRATDFSGITIGKSLCESDTYQAGTKEIRALRAELSPSQQTA
jgi:hypothetical protein